MTIASRVVTKDQYSCRPFVSPGGYSGWGKIPPGLASAVLQFLESLQVGSAEGILSRNISGNPYRKTASGDCVTGGKQRIIVLS
ncbi:MAG: hypothetical protein JW929_15520 [Anaerolineales bacterium]|nr:hypothetical protein [Anaerolineales bacterium]